MRKIITITALLLAVVFSRADAQEKQVTGKITSSDGSTLPGVTVIVNGTTIGTTSDMDGNYKITAPADATTLKFILVGMKTKEVAIASSGTIDVVMEADVLKLDEVVVTAIGISREKKALGYSTQTVGSDQLNTSGQGNVFSELDGKVSGLTIINSAGDPGSGVYMQLRGVSSLTGNNQPLIVVDGIPLDNSINSFDPTDAFFQASGAAGNTTGGVTPDNRAIDLNPSDIESITALKGPAATALYGIKANAGALIITTKKGGGGGKGRGMVVEFSTSTTFNTVNKLPDLQNIYGQGLNSTYYGPDAGTSKKKFSWGPLIDSLYYDGTKSQWNPNGNIVMVGDPTAKGKVSAYDNEHNFFQTGTTEDNNIAVSNGSDKFGYRMSIGNLHQKGAIPLTAYDKTSFNLSGNANLTNKLRVTATATYVKSSEDKAQQGSNTSGIMLGLLRTPPTFDNANGTSDPAHDSTSYLLSPPLGSGWYQRNYRGGPGYDNPYWTLNRNPFHQDLDRIFGSAQADYILTDWMTITYRLGGDMYSQDQKLAYDIQSNGVASGAGAIYLTDFFNKQYNSDLIFNLKKKFNDDFSGSLILGQNYFTQYNTVRQASGTGFALPDWFDLRNATSYLTSEGEAKIRRMALYGQAEVDFKNQLFLTISGRDETTSTLSPDNDNYFYPSASLGWVFTEPLGLSSNKTFPYGKLRLSYAGTGNDAPAQALQTYYVTTGVNDGFTSGINFPMNGFPGYETSNLTNVIGNPGLKPEHTNAFETGLDLSFLENRISLNATYYNQKTTDEIFTVPISYTTGNAAAILNAGVISNHGFELTLNTTPIKMKNGLQWDLTFNWNKNTSLVESLYPGVQNLFLGGFQNGGVYAVAGQPFGVIYGSKYVHTDTTLSSPLVINDNKSDPGYGMPIAGSQNGALGNINPDWTGSIISNLSFKGFTFGFQISIRHGGQIWDGTRGALAYFGTAKETQDRYATKTFSGVLGHLDANGNIVHYASDGVTELSGAGGANSNAVVTGQYYWQNIGNSFVGPTEPDIEDGSFIKLRQISLTYDFPKSCLQKMHFQRIAISVFANNIILHTNYSGVDPETSLTGPANGQGLDYFNNPGIKSIGARLIVGL